MYKTEGKGEMSGFPNLVHNNLLKHLKKSTLIFVSFKKLKLSQHLE